MHAPRALTHSDNRTGVAVRGDGVHERMWEGKGSGVRVRECRAEKKGGECEREERKGRACACAEGEEESVAANTPTRRTIAGQYRN